MASRHVRAADVHVRTKQLTRLTDITGPSSAELGIVFIYDIFGYSPQSNQVRKSAETRNNTILTVLQGADILATSDDEKKYRVYAPDFLKGTYAQISWFPDDTEEKAKNLGNMFSGSANPQTMTPEVISFSQKLAKDNPTIKKWAVIGFCWGAKIVALTLNSSDLFSVAATVHPAFIDEKDAAGVKVPFLMLPSKDEDAEDVKAFASKLKVEHKVETFSDQVHVCINLFCISISIAISLTVYRDGWVHVDISTTSASILNISVATRLSWNSCKFIRLPTDELAC